MFGRLEQKALLCIIPVPYHLRTLPVGTEDIFGVSFSSPNTGYAAGSRGKVYYWNGIDWADFDTGNHAWKAIDTLAFEDVWMVGNGSNIAHFDGSFTFYTSPENSNLTSIHMLSPTSGFAAGNKGIILEWDGSSWEATDLGSQAFEDIYMISSTEGWVVADNGTIFHLKNGIWQDESLNSSVALNTVYMLDAFDGWVAGQNAVYRWDGSSWNFFQSDPQQWRSLEMLDNTDGWLIGSNGTIYRFSQNYNPVGKFESRIFDSGAQNIGWHYIRWLETLNSDSSLTLSTRTGASPSVDATWSAWSIEYINKESTELTSPFNRYLQYRATLNRGFYGSENPHLNEVTIVTTPPAPDNVYAIDMISDDDGWAVGHAGTIFYYNGLQWVLHPDSPGGNEHLYGIDMVSSTEGWIVGKNGAIFHFDGSNWMREIYSGLFSSDLRAVSIVPSGSDFFGFAVGIGGRVIKYENGSWTDLGRPSSTRSLYGVQVISETEAWAVGDSGTIGHWTGVWEPIIDTGSTGWRAISMTADGTNGWIVGAAGRMIERVGGFWVPLPDGERAVTTTLYGVSMLDPNYAWAVGARGKTALWDGNAWREIQNAASQSIRAVSVSSPFSTWAVGDKNLFMKLIREGSYAPSGYLISSAFDTGVSSNMQVIEWDENTNCVGCNVELQIQVSNDGSSWSQWEGPQGMDGDEDDFYSIPPGEILSTDFNGYRWIRYKAILSGDGTDTPALSEIRINYK
jgi:photosystem II stability/assembly factor-like uncharacterized protein